MEDPKHRKQLSPGTEKLTDGMNWNLYPWQPIQGTGDRKRHTATIQLVEFDFDLACEVAAHLGTASPRKLCSFWNPAVELLAYLVFHDQADLENIPINFLIC